VLKEYLKNTVDPGGAPVTVKLFVPSAIPGSNSVKIGPAEGGGGGVGGGGVGGGVGGGGLPAARTAELAFTLPSPKKNEDPMLSAVSLKIWSTSTLVSAGLTDHTRPARPATIGEEKEVPDQKI